MPTPPDAWPTPSANDRRRTTSPKPPVAIVWCAGCASGEETYTLAIVIAEVIGIEAFQERVKLYGTDLDNDALAKARIGAYSERNTSSAAIRASCSARISGAA